MSGFENSGGDRSLIHRRTSMPFEADPTVVSRGEQLRQERPAVTEGLSALGAREVQLNLFDVAYQPTLGEEIDTAA